jgi:hypothetical protein
MDGRTSSSRIARQAAPVISVLVLSSVAVAWTASSGSGALPFAITHLNVPLFVKQNGPRGTRSVSWQGNPTFPVTVHERGICPESVDCGPRDAQGFGTPPATAVFPSRANPLVSRNFYFCSGNLTSNYVIGVAVWLTDAKGQRTPTARNFWVCKTH